MFSRSLLKESGSGAQKKCWLIRDAWNFEVVFGDIFMLFSCKIENPLFFTFTKDSRFYNWKARKCPQKRVQIFTRHELINTFFELRDLIPSTAIGKTSIVYGKITLSDRGSDWRRLKRIWKFLLTEISEMCSHLSLGARNIGASFFNRNYLTSEVIHPCVRVFHRSNDIESTSR